MYLCPMLHDSNRLGTREDSTDLGLNQALGYSSSTAPFRGVQGRRNALDEGVRGQRNVL